MSTATSPAALTQPNDEPAPAHPLDAAPLRFVTWPERRIENISSLLDALQARVGGADGSSTSIRVREVLSVVGRRAYGPLLLVIGLLAISPVALLPGSTFALALATLLIAGQMAVGLRRPWLPKRVLDLKIPADIMRKGVAAIRPYAGRVDRVLRPRLEFLARTPFANLVAIGAVVAALITFPLGFVPFAPAIPSLAVIFIGLGITARDGLLLALGGACLLGAVTLTWLLLA